MHFAFDKTSRISLCCKLSSVKYPEYEYCLVHQPLIALLQAF